MTEKKNRTIHYSFKATPEEDAMIQKKMKTFGIKNQSAFIRAMALNGYVLKLDLPELHEAVRLMGSVQAEVRIDMTMPKAPDPKSEQGGGVSPWEREAYGDGGRFGSMQMMPSGDPSKDRISVHYCGCGYNVARLLAEKGQEFRDGHVRDISAVHEVEVHLGFLYRLLGIRLEDERIRLLLDFRVRGASWLRASRHAQRG